MSQLYARADQLAEKIYDIKLYIPEWKVLFALDGKKNNIDLAQFLQLDQQQVDDALKHLAELGLISPKQIEMEEEAVAAEEETLEAPPAEEALDTEEEVSKIFEEEPEKEPEEEIEEKVQEEFEEETEEELVEPTAELEDIGDVTLGEEEEEFSLEPQEEVEEEEEKEGEEPLAPPEQPEGEEDLDQLINDLLKEETQEEEDVLADDRYREEPEEELKTETEVEEAEDREELEVGDIFETELEETEQSLEDMLETIEKEAEVEKEEEPEEVKPPVTEGPRKTILVVDDSVVIRKMVEIALENENYEIVSVANGKDALSYLDEKEPDIVILDIMLPDVNGLDVLKAIKASKDIPVVMLSAKDTPRETSRAKELGADDFIPKPFKDEELIGKIHELIGD